MDWGKRAIEKLYRDKATITAIVSDKNGSITKQTTKIIADDVPCKISLGSLKATERGIAAQIDYDAKLYLSPNLNVPDGAKIVVTGVNGVVTEYIGSRAYGYASHQEIFLQFKDKVR